VRRPRGDHRPGLAYLQQLRLLVACAARPLVQVPQVQRGAACGVAAMSPHDETTLQELLARADFQIAAHAAGGALWSDSTSCPECEGNGTHPESYDNYGEPERKQLPGLPYPVAFYVKCELCAGTGDAARWSEQTADYVQGGVR